MKLLYTLIILLLSCSTESESCYELSGGLLDEGLSYRLLDDFVHPDSIYTIDLEQIFCNIEIKNIKSKIYVLSAEDEEVSVRTNLFTEKPIIWTGASFPNGWAIEEKENYFINAKSKISQKKLIVYDYSGEGVLKVEVEIFDINEKSFKNEFLLYVLSAPTFSKKKYKIDDLIIEISDANEENLDWDYGIPYFKVYKNDTLVHYHYSDFSQNYFLEEYENEYFIVIRHYRGLPSYYKIINTDKKVLSKRKENLIWDAENKTYKF